MKRTDLVRPVIIAFILAFALVVAPTTQAQNLIPIYNPKSGQANVRLPRTHPAVTSVVPAQNGSSCTLLTFEGLGNLATIPTFQGISLPGWLSIIDGVDGGTGNFAAAPSGDTIAFWLYGNPTSQDIQIPAGASSISFYYSTQYPLTVSAYDSAGNLVNTASGPANFDSATGVYDIWSPIQVNSNNGSNIASITVTGYANYTGIDNLNVCQTSSIDSVEITQAIQQYQSLDDLKASLQASGEPPVPIISNKPAVLRVYFNQVEDVTNVTVRLSGVSNETKTQTLQPNCNDTAQRAGSNGCQSMDFYFMPPSGKWQATLDALDSSGNVLQEEVLSVKSRDTNSIQLHGVFVCDSKDSNGNWLCGNAFDLLRLTTLLRKIAPTSALSVDITSNKVTRDVTTYTYVSPDQGPPTWWSDMVRDVNSYYGWGDSLGDFLLSQRTIYYGIARTDLLSLNGTNGIAMSPFPSHGAASVTGAEVWSSTNVDVRTVAHETGHTLGLYHTNTGLPLVNSPPGCWLTAGQPGTDWPYIDNYIQSGPPSAPQREIGFDVYGHSRLDPNATFEIMGYCTPEWIAPQRYKTEIETLGGGAVTSPSVATTHPQIVASSTPVPFWLVRGVILPLGVQFDPLFQLTIQGNTGTGTGTYSLIVENSGGQSLFTRQFTPETPVAEGPATNNTGPPSFSETLPVTSGAGAIVLMDPNGNELGRITLGGTPPQVAIATPTGGFVGSGTQPVMWTVKSNAANSASMVLYSPDAGITWSNVGQVQNATSLAVNFDQLPGSSQALIQVLVSDGVNTGSATSPIFTVTKKKPTVVQIDNPTPNSAQPSADPVYLSGSAYDPDDGALSGSALQWSSSIQGSLGSGSPLSVSLQPGNHTINLVATDSDGNSLTAVTNITIGGQPPVVNLTTEALDNAPTTCEAATIGATPGQNGAPLSIVQYSLDGGTSYSNVLLNMLPYKFIVPGSGFFHLVARAYDVSGQSNALDTSFFTQSACQSSIPIAAVVLSSLTFTSQPVGTTSAPRPVTLSNTGNATLTITSIAASANFGATNTCPSSVADGGSCTINVTFSPTATGALAGTLTINDNSNGVDGSTQTVTLSGTGTGAVASLASSSLTFAAQISGTSSPPQTVTLTNTGNTSLTISGITASGDFSQTNTCGTGVGAGDNCTISVMFKPTAGGTRTGSVTISDNAPGSPHNVALSGTGQDFTLISASGSSTTAKVAAGSPASYTLSLGGEGGLSGAVTFTCAGAPSEATCTVSPNPATVGSSAANVTVSVSTTAPSASTPRSRPLPPVKPLSPALRGLWMLVLALLTAVRAFLRRKQTLWGWHSTALLVASGLLLALALAGCGGGGGGGGGGPTPNPGTPTGTYTLTVTGTTGSGSSGLSHSVTLTLTVS